MGSYSGTINISKSVQYIYDANGNYYEEGDVLFIDLSTSSSNTCKCTSASGPVTIVTASDYSTNPTVRLALMGRFTGNSLTFSVTWTPSVTVALPWTDTYTFTINDSTQTTTFEYRGLSNESLESKSSLTGSTSAYFIRNIWYDVTAYQNDYAYRINSWYYTYNGSNYNAGGYTVFPNDTYFEMKPAQTYAITVYLSLRDYPEVGSNRSYRAVMCRSGTNKTTFTIPANPSSQHYVFNGYYNYNNTVQYTAGQVLEASTGYTVYARWTGNTYTTSFNVDGGSSVNPQSSTYPATITLPSTSKAHYTFDGWYDAQTGGNRVGGAGDAYQPVGNNTLYVRYIADTYRVTYNTEGSTTYVDVVYPNTTSLPSRTKQYYDFNGWYTQSSGGTKIGSAGYNYQPTADITLYAQFTPSNYTVTYVTSGSSVITPITANHVTGTTLPSTTKSHYGFDGWYDAETGGNRIGSAGVKYYPTASITLYAHFTANQYTVTYITDGAETTETVSHPDTVTLPNRTKAHYTFEGWYSQESGGTKYGVAGGTYQPLASITMYAQFKGITYRTTYSTTGSAVTPAYVDTVYPAQITLPTTSKQHYTFGGWYSGNTKVGDAGDTYTPGETLTLTANFIADVYTVTFKDADGTVILSDEVTYPNYINIPTLPNRPAFTFKGWANDGSTAILSDPAPNATKYYPVADATLIRRYGYSRNLKNTDTGGTTYATLTADYPNAVSLPTQANHNATMDVRGYRLKGWSISKQVESPSVNPTADYVGTYTPALTDTFTSLYIARIPATLNSITIPTLIELNKDGTSEVSVSNGKIIIDPEDWLGNLEWVRSGGSSYFSQRNSDATGKKIYLTGLTATNGDAGIGLTAKGKVEVWNPNSSYIESDYMQVGVSEYIPVYFYTRNNTGTMGEYLVADHYDGNNNLINSWYVKKDIHGNFSWEARYDHANPPRAFPPPPTRDGFTFAGWLSGEGQLITDAVPPQYAVDCTAVWIQSYKAVNRDMLMFQQFNKEGNVIQLQLDLGLIKSAEETFSFSLTTVPTPTMPSDMTFITDLSCTETINVKIIRKCPAKVDDTSDNSLNWSNGYWIAVLRGLVDRWQAETDGVKFLFIPKGMKSTVVNGEIACYGDNYDMLGYCLPREYDDGGVTKYNTGLLYGDNNEYVLLGYNCIITSYSDNYTAGQPDVVEVSMILGLGGMVSQYQDWAKGMLLQ